MERETSMYRVVVGLYVSTMMFAAHGVNLKEIVSQSIPLRQDGKIHIPAHIKRVKLDIGLSYSAPMSQYWLTHEDNLLVFGFEPNPASIASILGGNIIRKDPAHGEPLDKKLLGKSFFLIPCALGLAKNTVIPFFVTLPDGCSSIYAPKYIPVERIIEVPIFSLADFFDLFPFDTHPVIDYIKIDVQGADLDIVKSGGHYIMERVVYITLEAENDHYKNTTNSFLAINNYMHSIGFVPYPSPYTSDPTYFNPRYTEYVKQHNVQIYQNG
jgi:Methyltransferase FkbM domain